MAKRPDYLAVDNIAATDDYGTNVYTLDAFDTFALKPTTNNVIVRFSPPAPYGNYDWRREMRFEAGVFTGFDGGDLAMFGHCQVKNAVPSANATYSIRAVCKGGG